MIRKSKHVVFFYIKYLCLILCCVFAANGQCKSLSACNTAETYTYLEEIKEIFMTEEQFAKVKYYKIPQFQAKAVAKNSYDSSYGFSLLTDSEKAVYQKLEMASADFHNSTEDAQIIDDENIAIGVELEVGELSKERIADVVVGFIYDHPQFFWTKGYS